MNITFTVDEQIAKDAEKAAQKMGKSLEQVLLSFIEQLAAQDQPEQKLTQFELSSLSSSGELKGWKFDRDEANQR